MRRSPSGAALLPVFSLLAIVAVVGPRPASAADPVARATAMARAAAGWLAILEPAKRRQANLPFTHARRMRWQATPGQRVGLAWGRMSKAQRVAAETLVRSGLSASGWRKFQGVVTLEGILRVQAAAHVRVRPSWRDPGLYWLVVFGTPSATGTWSWKLEGHHFSRQFTCVAGEVSVAPGFHGANPARSRQGLRVLAAEEDDARALFTSLGNEQRKRALARRGPRDFLPSSPRDLSDLPVAGLSLGEMSAAQRPLLWKLLGTWLECLHPELSKLELKRIRAAKPDKIRFLWMGSPRPGQPHGYRIRGATFLAEYWHGGNHIHSVWRDPLDEYGLGRIRRAGASAPARGR